jgi:hypothetical protein
MRKNIIISKIISPAIVLLLAIAAGCTNPFAPALNENPAEDAVLGDQTTIEGVFRNFRYAYTFKDTVVYGKLLHNDFTFIFRNYEKGVDESWGREEDMISTSRFFQASQNLDLIWNDVVIAIGDSLVQDISRGFNLTIVFDPTDIVTITGRANFRLMREHSDDVWKIIRWRDESNY